jgi:phosphatidylethanolamine-binding protein (PEBP) family uncharacterized protein
LAFTDGSGSALAEPTLRSARPSSERIFQLPAASTPAANEPRSGRELPSASPHVAWSPSASVTRSFAVTVPIDV